MKQVLLAILVSLFVGGCGGRREGASPAHQEPAANQEPSAAAQQTSDKPAAASEQDRSSGVARLPDVIPGTDQGKLSSAEKGSGIKTSNTGDSDVWPAYDFPLEVRVEVPRVPEAITKPSPEVPGKENG